MKLRHAVYAVGLALALIGISKPVSADTLPAYDITADIPASQIDKNNLSSIFEAGTRPERASNVLY